MSEAPDTVEEDEVIEDGEDTTDEDGEGEGDGGDDA